jgi:hypothetical protein
VDIHEGLCRELPDWMFDASLCRAMVLGRPQVCLEALKELRVILLNSRFDSAGSWNCLKKEGWSDETTGQSGSETTTATARNRESAPSSGRASASGTNRSHVSWNRDGIQLWKQLRNKNNGSLVWMCSVPS